MSHRATICICRISQSFCMYAHHGSISKQYFTSPQYFITHCMSDTVLPGTRVLRAKFQILSVGTKELAATQEWLGKHSSKCYQFVEVKCQVGRKERQVSSRLASFCAFFALLSLAGLTAKMSQDTELLMSRWQSIPGMPRGVEREAASQAVHITSFRLCYPGRQSGYIIVFALWCGPDSAESIIVSSFSSMQPISCLVSAILCNRLWK